MCVGVCVWVCVCLTGFKSETRAIPFPPNPNRDLTTPMHLAEVCGHKGRGLCVIYQAGVRAHVCVYVRACVRVYVCVCLRVCLNEDIDLDGRLHVNPITSVPWVRMCFHN